MNNKEQKLFDLRYAQYRNLLTLQGYSKTTIENYSRSIRRLALACNQCPDQRLKKDDFQQYFTKLLETHSWSTVKCDLNGFRHYWELLLECDWPWINLVKPPKSKHLPDILSPQEISAVLECVHKRVYRIYLYTVYSLGIRLSEALFLQVSDIDAANKRVHIREGKGCKDRFVILPDNTYKLLRKFWATHRHPQWIFPSQHPQRYSGPMDKGAVQKAIKMALSEAGIHKHISIHNLRHSFGTHSLEGGMDLRSLQELMGHESPKTTAIYTQMTDIIQKNNHCIVNDMVNKINMPSMEEDHHEN